MTVWFITGASRGFGLEIAREALSRGDKVVATARDPRAITSALGDAGGSLVAVELDVHRPDHVTAAFDVNVFGLLAVTRAVLPHLRAHRSGLVVNLSSVGGFVSWPGWGVYVAAGQLDDYAASSGVARTWAVDANQGQEGDPRKAAKIIVDLAATDRVLQRIQVGARAIQDIAAKVEFTAREQDQWRDVGLSADFDAQVYQ